MSCRIACFVTFTILLELLFDVSIVHHVEVAMRVEKRRAGFNVTHHRYCAAVVLGGSLNVVVVATK